MKNRNKIFEKRSEKGKKISEKELLKAKNMLEKVNNQKFKIKVSYEIGKQFYNKKTSKKKGIKKLIENGINEKYVIDYLNLFSKLIEGKLYIRPFKKEIIEYYFQKISEEYKVNEIKNALFSFTQHLDYYNKILEKNSNLSRSIFGKYWKIAFENRQIHPNENGVKTFHTGGMNGIVTKRKSTTDLWENYRMFSNLLSERLEETSSNDLTYAYTLNLVKKYYSNLEELKHQKNYFKDENGNVFLIKSKITNKINTLELEISNWDFDYLVLFVYNLKGNPTYRVKIPIEVAKENSTNSRFTINENNLNDKRNEDISLNILIMEKF